MIKHRKKIEEHEHIEADKIIYAIENISVSVVDEEDVLKDKINEHDNANTTFYNHSQLENKSDEELIKCDKCDFKAGQKIDLNNHKEEIH